MQAALVTSYNGIFDVVDVAIDRPIDDEVLIEVRASGLCHSDILIAENDRGLSLPIVCGHEVSGVVSEVGPGVRSVNVGDRVTTCVAAACLRCSKCVSGRPWLCEGKESLQRPSNERPRLSIDGHPITALSTIGGFAERVLTSERAIVTIDPRVPFDAAALLGCAVVTGVGSVLNAARVRPGDSVAVVGCGGVGLNVIQGAKIAGASRVIAVDISQGRLDRAQFFGATDYINGLDGSTVDQVRALIPGGVDHAFEVVGRAETVNDAVQILGRGGTAYLIGASAAPLFLAGVATSDLILGSRSIVGIYGGATMFKDDIPRYVGMYLQGQLLLDELISERIALEQVTDTYKNHDQGDSARAVVVF